MHMLFNCFGINHIAQLKKREWNGNIKQYVQADRIQIRLNQNVLTTITYGSVHAFSHGILINLIG